MTAWDSAHPVQLSHSFLAEYMVINLALDEGMSLCSPNMSGILPQAPAEMKLPKKRPAQPPNPAKYTHGADTESSASSSKKHAKTASESPLSSSIPLDSAGSASPVTNLPVPKMQISLSVIPVSKMEQARKMRVLKEEMSKVAAEDQEGFFELPLVAALEQKYVIMLYNRAQAIMPTLPAIYDYC